MFGIHSYWLFLVTGILLNLTPGQDTMFIIGKSLTGGRRAGAAAALGISVGSVFHTLAAALGLSAILKASALAFTIVKLVGAAYLFYLGVKLILSRKVEPLPGASASASASTAEARAHSRSAFVQGIVTNILNPKVALFFLALLPQFIDPGSTSKTLAFLALGGTFITTGLIWCLVLAFAAAGLQSFFQKNPNMRTLIDRVVGTLFLAMSARLAWSR